MKTTLTPRLFGGMSYGAKEWHAVTLPSYFAIKSSPPSLALLGYCIVVGLLFGGILFWVSSYSVGFGHTAFKFGAAGLLVVMVLYALAFNAVLRNNQRKPNILIITFSDHTVDLSRRGISFPIESVDHWEVVSGNWVKGEMEPRYYGDIICELHLVLKENDVTGGGVLIYPIVGGFGRHELDKIAEELARVTGVPVKFVDESITFMHYDPIPMDSEHSKVA